MRLVIDTNILVSGYGWNGTPYRLIEQAIDNQVVLFASDLTLAEFANVIFREEFGHKLASKGLTPQGIYESYKLLTTSVKVETVEAICKDPTDDKFLATALAADADILVSGDGDLLELHPWRGIKILGPTDALNYIDSRANQDFVREPAQRYGARQLPAAA